jgi:hypothetical protein
MASISAVMVAAIMTQWNANADCWDWGMGWGWAGWTASYCDTWYVISHFIARLEPILRQLQLQFTI